MTKEYKELLTRHENLANKFADLEEKYYELEDKYSDLDSRCNSNTYDLADLEREHGLTRQTFDIWCGGNERKIEYVAEYFTILLRSTKDPANKETTNLGPIAKA